MDFAQQLTDAQLAEATAAASLQEVNQKLHSLHFELRDAEAADRAHASRRQLALATTGGDEDIPVIESKVDTLKAKQSGLQALKATYERQQREATARIKGVALAAAREVQAQAEKEYRTTGEHLARLYSALLELEKATGDASLSMGRARLYIPGLAKHSAYGGELPATNPQVLPPAIGQDWINEQLAKLGVK